MLTLTQHLRTHTQHVHRAMDASAFTLALTTHTLPLSWLERFLRLEHQLLRQAHILQRDHTWDAIRSLPSYLEERADKALHDHAALHQHPHPILDLHIQHALDQLCGLTPTGVLGLLYVSEGSALGGLDVAQHIHATFHPSPPPSTRFSPPPVVAQRWNNFRRALNTLPLSPEQRTEATNGALIAFACYAEGMDLIADPPTNPSDEDSTR